MGLLAIWKEERGHHYYKRGEEVLGVCIRIVQTYNAYGGGRFLGNFATLDEARSRVMHQFSSNDVSKPQNPLQ